MSIVLKLYFGREHTGFVFDEVENTYKLAVSF